MPPSATQRNTSVSSGDLPERIFAANRYPGHLVRINSYSRPRYLIDILHVLDGMPQLDTLLASPLGALFSLPLHYCSLSGQLVHQMLCRQLCTSNSDEMWFTFGGQPLRLSLIEFEQLTGLSCAPFPPAADLVAATTHVDGSAPYWYTLIGRNLGGVTVADLVDLLKSKPTMPIWRKFRLALVVIVEGILLCRTQPVKPSLEVVEMVKDVDFFLQYPWGRHSFKRLLRMVKIGDYIPDKASLIKKLKQVSIAVHGFPLAIQLLAFRSIPLLLKYLPHAEDQATFLDQPVACLRKCKSYHTSNILSVEHDPSLKVMFPLSGVSYFRSTEEGDPKVQLLETLVSSGYKFNNSFSFGGDASLPSLYSSKRKQQNIKSRRFCSDDHSPRDCRKRYKTSNVFSSVEDVDGIVTLKLNDFKESLLADLGQLLLNATYADKHTGCVGNSSSLVASGCTRSASRLTRSGCVGLHGLSSSRSGSSLNNQTPSIDKVSLHANDKGKDKKQSSTSLNSASMFVNKCTATCEPVGCSSQVALTSASPLKRVTRSSAAFLQGLSSCGSGSSLNNQTPCIEKVSVHANNKGKDKKQSPTSLNSASVFAKKRTATCEVASDSASPLKRVTRSTAAFLQGLSSCGSGNSLNEHLSPIDKVYVHAPGKVVKESRFPNSLDSSSGDAKECFDVSEKSDESAADVQHHRSIRCTSKRVLRPRYAKKKTTAEVMSGRISLMQEAMSNSRTTHMISPTCDPTLSNQHLRFSKEKLSSSFGSSTTDGANSEKRFVLVNPPPDVFHDLCHIDGHENHSFPFEKSEKNEDDLIVASESLPVENRCLAIIPLLECPNAEQRDSCQTSQTLNCKAEYVPGDNTAGPTHDLRSRKVASKDDMEKGSVLVLGTLEKINSMKLEQFLAKLRRFRGREYIIRGEHFPRSFFNDILGSQNWISNLHIDMLVGYVWEKHNNFLAKNRMTVLDSMFACIITNKFICFKQQPDSGGVMWHPMLIAYVRGDVIYRRHSLQWIRDVDVVYLPMNWGKRHWVTLQVDLTSGHINILDPFEDFTSARKVVSLMTPFAQQLPQLIHSVFGMIPSSWPATGFTFSRTSGLAQNKRGGDCGPLTVKFMELHAYGLHETLSVLTPEQVDNLRMRYALDLYEEYVCKV